MMGATQAKGIEITLSERITRKRIVTAVPVHSCWAAFSQETIDRMSPKARAKDKCGVCGELLPAGDCVLLFFENYDPPNQLAHTKCVPKEYVPAEEKKKP